MHFKNQAILCRGLFFHDFHEVRRKKIKEAGTIHASTGRPLKASFITNKWRMPYRAHHVPSRKPATESTDTTFAKHRSHAP